MRPRVLLTGGTGFVGRNLCAELVRSGIRVAALYRGARPAGSGKIDWIDLQDGVAAAVARAFSDCRVDAVVHLAGRINGSPKRIDADNVAFTAELLEALKRTSCQPRLVYLSSVSAVASLGVYGACKRAAEDLIAAWTPDFVVLRASLVFGPYESTNVGTIVRAVRSWPIVPIPGGRTVRLQPLFVADLCAAINQAVVRPEVRGRYVVAGPGQVRLWDMVSAIAERVCRHPLLVGVPLAPVQWVGGILTKVAPRLPVPMQQISTLHDHPPWSSVDAARDLGFSARSFAEGIACYVEPTTVKQERPSSA